MHGLRNIKVPPTDPSSTARTIVDATRSRGYQCLSFERLFGPTVNEMQHIPRDEIHLADRAAAKPLRANRSLRTGSEAMFAFGELSFGSVTRRAKYWSSATRLGIFSILR